MPTGRGAKKGPARVDPEEEKYKELFESRARLAEKDPERRLFLQFDAWSDPDLTRWLDRFSRRLSPRAKRVFAHGRPRIRPGVMRCAYEILPYVPIDRARTLAGHQDYGIPVQIGSDAADLLKSYGLSARDMIHAVANYQIEIFKSTFPLQALPTPELDRCFVRFATGKLRIDPGPQDKMNAEPDSAYFFSFAEFCIQAAYVGAAPGHDWWHSLGCLFAALQDAYCQCYHNPKGERRWTEYRDVFFDTKRAMDEEVVLTLVESVRRRDRTLHDLVERVTSNAYWAFYDDVS